MKKVEGNSKNRKPRSDRKRQIQPVISMELFECLDRIAYITATPLKDVGEKLCLEGLRSKKVIDELSPFFRRDYQYEDEHGGLNVITGSTGRLPFKVNRGDGDRARISIRFHQTSHDLISTLAYSLDLTIASATTLLLEVSFEMEIGLQYIERFIQYELLSVERREQISEILSFINEQLAPEHITLGELMDKLAQEAYDQGILLRPFLENWINQYYD